MKIGNIVDDEKFSDVEVELTNDEIETLVLTHLRTLVCPAAIDKLDILLSEREHHTLEEIVSLVVLNDGIVSALENMIKKEQDEKNHPES